MALPVIHFEEPRVLAALPPYPVCALPPLSAAYPVLPRSEWREIDLSHLVARVRDQGQTSECVGCASATAAEVAQAKAGDTPVRLASGFVYALCNHDRDQGAVISDAMDAVVRHGVCLESEMPEGAVFRAQIPQAAYETAKKYRAARVHHCHDYDSVGTALALGFPVVVGVLVGQNFTRLDAEGVVPTPDRILGGHALCLTGLRKRARGGYLYSFVNSWGPRFGRQGFAAMGQELIDYAAQRYGQMDAFALETVVDLADALPPVAVEA